MPNLVEYDAGNLALRPTETGVEARAATARRVGAFYNQKAGAQGLLASETARLGAETAKLGSETAALGDLKGSLTADAGRRIGSSISDAGDAAVKALDNQQITHGSAAYTGLLLQKTQEWNALVKNADPNDPTIAKKFMDGLEGDLAKFKEDGFYTEGGQKFAETHVEALRMHMLEKTQADMATLAGHAAVVNQQQSINSLSATVHSDPASLDFSLAALKSSTEGMISTSPNLNGTQAAAARSEILQKGSEAIVKSAAIGYIEKTSKVPPWATDPKYAPYVNGAELQMLEKAAKVQAKSDLLQNKQIELYNRQVADQQVHATANKIMTRNVASDPVTGRPIITPGFFRAALDIARNNPDAPSAASTARTLTDWGEHQQNLKENIVSDPTVKSALSTGLFDPNKPTTMIDVMRAESEGKLSHADAATIRGNVKLLEETPLHGPVYQDTMKAAHDQLIVNVPGIPGKDVKGTENYASFIQTFVPQYLAKFRAGTLPPNALDVKDPNSMISQAMAPFKRTPSERMSDYVAGAGGLGGATPAPATPGRVIGDVKVPALLGGIAALQYNKTTGQWRDQTSGKIYDAKGNEVAR